MSQRRLPRSVLSRLGHYVYLYVHPKTHKVFYVGKGRGNRAFSHLDGHGRLPHARVIRRLRREGLHPRVEFLTHGLADDATASAVEAAAIDAFGVRWLANCIRGRGSGLHGRMTEAQILAHYRAGRASIRDCDSAVLIRINHLHRYDMTPLELYEATRGVWRVGRRREKAKYALAVYDGVIREVYTVDRWAEAGSTAYRTRDKSDFRLKGRWEFVGRLAPRTIRGRYVGKSVAHRMKRGNQNPITYVNCD